MMYNVTDVNGKWVRVFCTLLFYEGHFRVQHLAQGHFSMQSFGKMGIELLTFR